MKKNNYMNIYEILINPWVALSFYFILRCPITHFSRQPGHSGFIILTLLNHFIITTTLLLYYYNSTIISAIIDSNLTSYGTESQRSWVICPRSQNLQLIGNETQKSGIRDRMRESEKALNYWLLSFKNNIENFVLYTRKWETSVPGHFTYGRWVGNF